MKITDPVIVHEHKWVFNLNFEGEPLKLDLLTDPDMFIMFEQAIRGGISQVGQLRYAKADEHHKLFYIDANNLYGWAMAQMLPIKNFKWIKEEKVKKLERKMKAGFRLSTSESTGLLLMVDLEYPKEIQKDHLDLPLAPELLNIRGEMLSPEQQEHYGHELRKQRS